MLPTGRLALQGPVTVGRRFIHLDLRDPGGGAHLVHFLFPTSAPASALGGIMSGATFIGPEAQPSATRIVLIRLPGPSPRLRTAEAYLPSGASVAADLLTLGLKIAAPKAADRHIATFLASAASGLDEVSVAPYRSLAKKFDPIWLINSPDRRA